MIPQDTARLFGAIENDQSVLPALGKTRKSLEEVARIMFGQDEAMAPKACGNAGNDASVSHLPKSASSRETVELI